MLVKKLYISTILAAAMCAFASASPCFAENLQDNTEPTSNLGNTLSFCEQTGFVAQENWQASNCYNGSLFLAGNNVKDSSSVGGIGFIAGSNLDLLGSYEYGFHAGSIVNISGTYVKDVFLAGSVVNIDANANIAGNLYVAGESIKISAPVQNAYVVGSSLEIDAEILGDVYTNVGQITLSPNAKIGGTLKYDSNSTISGLEDGKVAHTEAYAGQNSNTSVSAAGLVTSICSASVVLLFAAFFAPQFLARIRNKSASDSFTDGAIDTLKGVAILVGAPLLAIVLLLLLVGLQVAIIVVAFYIAGLILTTSLVGYYISCRLFKKFKKGGKWSEFLWGCLGIATVKILSIIPYIGSLVSFIVLVWGLGILWQVVISRKRQSYMD